MKLSLALIVVFINGIFGFKVLGILPFGSKSHFAIGHAILKSLAEAGHNVTSISPYPLKEPMENYKDISTEDYVEVFFKNNAVNMFAFENTPIVNKIMELIFIYWINRNGNEVVKYHAVHPKVIEFMNTYEKFDICFMEIFNYDALLGIAEHVGCKVISYTTTAVVKWADDMTGNVSPPSYVPRPYVQYSDKMSFRERLMNTFYAHIEDIVYEFIIKPNQRRLYEKYFPNATKTFDEMYKDTSMIFMNTHISLTAPRPYLPSFVEIGGIHIQPVKKLPKVFQNFLDSATDGVILFSMGSVIRSYQWPVEKREAFVKVFGKLKQKVLWKYENDTLPNKPDNVMISSWLPQRDILAHPNVKAYICHGGLLGTTEAVYEGVPVLGIPIFGDQKTIMAKAVTRGYGLQVYFKDVSEETIGSALDELLNNPMYKENAKIISTRFKDRPMTPQQSVVYWTEYVHRHGGAPHLKAAGNDLDFIAFHMIDVYAVLFFGGISFIFINYLIIKWIFMKFSGKPKKTEKKNEKKLKKK
ncbi:hypothetical protein PVAND_000878 [Polypedilum vanderplanki]|uniref:UDP-glucuronosyltransferase n=1 Tax=Polypedilum vanderplanki TaxID=319348 RepID=A0A9J6BMK1_POLVA|nr:hypothetical protein PVAND_000878 [Polypedilum vanderplanki]